MPPSGSRARTWKRVWPASARASPGRPCSSRLASYSSANCWITLTNLMPDFLKKLAEILEVPEVKAGDELKSFPQWDSLAVLSVIAMLDADYGVNLRAADFGTVQSAGELWNL